ncbi:hypothetical protein MWU49_12380 [Alcanivorax sp. S6407]|uniref:hypothetical protein n=1 Tax=Alcanivorax sp. S6407 TaxID=2926424 RepID=UPI001FF4F425|nr:hypothetical protein [Alcanivorax sp. S6407]MCK0154506.1 hypothetical protein [Alcanivorax sp. S6407]
MRHGFRLSLSLLLPLVVAISGCSDSSSSASRFASASAPAYLTEETLKSAASFLGGATGKETPVSVDTVVFINTVLGLNEVESDPQNLYGDLWLLLRDEYGAPLLDAQGCVQPLASEPVEWPDMEVRDTVPMTVEEYEDGEFTCTVVEGYESYTMELEIGRLNMVRNMANNPDALARGLAEAINTINQAQAVSLDPAGRLVLTIDDGGELVDKTIDSPRENLALYHALMTRGRLAGYGPEKHEGGETLPPQWVEIDPEVPLGDLAYLRDGEGELRLINGYADLSAVNYNRQNRFQEQLLSFVQYIDGATCPYWDMIDYAWLQVFEEEPYIGSNMEGFARLVDDNRRVIVFVHDIIQDPPVTDLATLPTPAGDRIDVNKAAAAFLGGASNKTVPLTIDGLVLINTVLGLNEVEFTYKGEILGDLWALLRNANGEPLLDANQCPQPLASDPVVWPDDIEQDTVPMQLDENGDCEIVPGYETFVVEVELGRLNGTRVALTNPGVYDRALYDVVNSINASEGVKLDVAGRLAYGVMTDDGVVYQTVDSPRAGVAMYLALMRWGKLEGQVEIMEDGVMVVKNTAITLDDAILNAEGLGYLKHGSVACQGNPDNCGATLLPSGYVDYSGFAHRTQDVYAGVDVSYVERQPDDPDCAYGDRTADIWERVLGSDPYDGSNIEAFVKQAEDTRTVVEFVHTIIHDPLPE